jgi:hypothetical protein
MLPGPESDPNPSLAGGFRRRRQNGDVGDAAEGEVEETGGLRWERDRVRVSCAGEVFNGLLQKRDEDGENTGELQTATEDDIVS